MTSGYLVSWLSGYRHRVIGLSGYRRIGLSGYFAVALAGCAVGTPSAPALSGPSEMGLSIAISASPDLMARDGSAQSVITVTARDSNSQPVRNLNIRMDVAVGGVLVDLGTLSARTISTGNDGRATLTYTAPPPAQFGAPNDATIQVVASPIGTDAANANSTGVSIRLTSSGMIQPPIGAPIPSFFVSPTEPKPGDTVNFNGVASTAAPGHRIVSWVWDFGDGARETREVPTVDHSYTLSRKYTVILTVIDDIGRQATTAVVLEIKP